MNKVSIEFVAYGRRQIPKDLVHVLTPQLEEVHLHVEPCRRYTAAELCGVDFWFRFTPKQRRVIGACAAYLCSIGVLKMNRVTAIGIYPVRYAVLPTTI